MSNPPSSSSSASSRIEVLEHQSSLLLNAALGWAWADPLAGLVIAAVAIREGLEAWRGDGCACGPTSTAAGGFPLAQADSGCEDNCCHPETNL